MIDSEENLILGYEETYFQRRDEIKDMIVFMALMDAAEQGSVENSYYSVMEKAKGQVSQMYCNINVDVIPDYSLIASVIRSNTKIMIYNLIEYAASSLLQAIYDRICDDQCGYAEVSDELKKIWHSSHLFKRIRDPNANHTTVEQTSKRLVDIAISKATLTFEVRDVISGGNMDGDTILKLFQTHGVQLHPANSRYRQDELKDIKNQRNELAHGAISFSDAGNQVTVSDLNNILVNVDSFLNQLRSDVIAYLTDRQYRVV